jgi:PAS domain S-box-containing protein
MEFLERLLERLRRLRGAGFAWLAQAWPGLWNRLQRPKSLSFYLLMMSVSLVVPAMAVATYGVVGHLRSEAAGARQQLVRAAADLSADIDRELSGLITVLETLASSVSLARGDLAQFHERASSALGPRQAYVLLLDPSGQQRLNTRVPYGTPLPATSDPATAKVVVQSRSLYVSDGFVGGVSGQRVVNIAVPIVRDGAVRQILALTINASRFEAVIAAFDAPKAWSVRLVDRKGQVLAAAPGDSAAPVPETGGPLLTERLADDGTAWIEAQVSSLTGWRMVVGAPRALIDASFWRSLAWLATAGLLATALAAAFCLYLSRKVVGAMATIQSATYRLALGRQVHAEPLPLLEASNVMHAVAQAGVLVDARTRQLLQSEARYQAALRVGRIGSWETDFVEGTRTWSQEAMDLFQISLPSSKGIVGGPNDELCAAMHPDDRHLLERYHRLIQTLDEIEATYRIVLADGSVRHMAGRGKVIARCIDGSAHILVNVVADVTERAQAEQRVAERSKELELAKARFEALVQATAQIVWSTTPAGEVVEDSPTWRAFTGQTYEGWKGTGWLQAVHPDDRERTLLAWREAVASSSPYNIEYRLCHVSGGYRWTSARGVPLKNSEGEVTAWVGMNEDIADRKRRDEHLQLVMRELSHRTKNLLAVIQSIASRTFRDDVAGPVSVKTFIDRLHGIAVSHDLLVRGEWGGASLQELVTDHLAPFGAVPSKTVSISGPRVLLKPAVAQSIGLALHELATNAAKYGALGDSGGRLDIAWEIATNGSGSLLSLRWSEKPGGGTQPTQTAGFGRMLLERIVASSINGSSTYEIGKKGVLWQLSAPLEEVLSEELRHP